MSNKYQTLSEFIRNPFGKSDSMEKTNKYTQRYKDYILNNKIRVEGYCEVENSYYVHVKVPSESNKEGKYEYDVVIRFFTDDPMLLKQASLQQYFIQFFSNSPGFIYKYAALYKKEGYLIESLYNKLDPEFKDVMPEKSNSSMELSYDNTIFFACKFLSEHKFRILNKRGILLQRRKNLSKFMADISDFKSVKFDQDILTVERQLRREIDRRKGNKTKTPRTSNNRVKEAGKSTSKERTSVTYVVKKNGSKNIKKKISSKKTTRKI